MYTEHSNDIFVSVQALFYDNDYYTLKKKSNSFLKYVCVCVCVCVRACVRACTPASVTMAATMCN